MGKLTRLGRQLDTAFNRPSAASLRELREDEEEEQRIAEQHRRYQQQQQKQKQQQ
eukprot:CAMPEP_0201512366 /NCGR_PEP_ID=MMETSP0161_2-20130828/4640_1 /ASSEMBLY_ACC=CAM_ASM_000251 /TAXON_ID=180227 /ORGANISM="Neoparamoeba aestuarina, Strain SoJaBio B1-5/56/2" /LENGTH=54 /DNA_ID=CAMNT_0047908199 /DNA_START=48 /DNA_END=209 /DNA_ORIENTATION=-